MPVAGLVRLRKHQFGRQSVFGTKVAAVKAYPFSGTPDVDLSWTDREVDTGSIDITAAPHRVAPNITADLTDPALEYNTIPLLMSGIFGGAETPVGAGTAKTWTHLPASTTVDAFDPMTYQFGDDVLTDWFQLGDGILESLTITAGEPLVPLTTSMTWRFGSAASTGSTDSPVTGTVPTAGLSVDPNGALVYLKDIGIYVSDTVYDLAGSQINDALHTFELRITQEVDLKFYANGDQTYDVDAYGRGPRVIELECAWAKTADTVGLGSEADHWFSDEAVTRYISIRAESLVAAEYDIPYSWVLGMPMRYYTRTDGESQNNTTVILTGKAFYDPTEFDGVFSSVAVTTQATL